MYLCSKVQRRVTVDQPHRQRANTGHLLLALLLTSVDIC